MRNAIIGYTGFVGGNLVAQTDFSDQYNSQNIAEIDNQEFDLVICSAARAEKWRINQEPEKDLAELNGLIDHLKTIKTKQFVLISTVDVYKNPVGVDEDTPLETDGLHAYGLNRIYLENFVREQFPNALIVRLSGLFGTGLKKNVIYDLLHDNNVDKLHYAGVLQYYNLDTIWRDIKTALDNGLQLVNLAAEPIRTDEIAREAFGIENFHNEPEGVTPAKYDMHTKHAGLYGQTGAYMYTKAQEMPDIIAFVKREQVQA